MKSGPATCLPCLRLPAAGRSVVPFELSQGDRVGMVEAAKLPLSLSNFSISGASREGGKPATSGQPFDFRSGSRASRRGTTSDP